MNKIYYTKEWENKITDVINSSQSMAEAGSKLPMNQKTFAFHAKRLGIYKPNESGKGMKKPNLSKAKQFPLKEILNGKYPHYSTSKLNKRLLKENIKEHKCEKCLRTTWMGMPIPLEVHHKDGTKKHNYENISMLCPNCHAQTDNYRGKRQPGSVET